MTFGKELIQSANEALAIAEGHIERVAVFAKDTIDEGKEEKHKGFIYCSPKRKSDCLG